MGLVDRASRVVSCLDSLLVLHRGSIALVGYIKNLTNLDVTPDFGPGRVSPRTADR